MPLSLMLRSRLREESNSGELHKLAVVGLTPTPATSFDRPCGGEPSVAADMLQAVGKVACLSSGVIENQAGRLARAFPSSLARAGAIPAPASNLWTARLLWWIFTFACFSPVGARAATSTVTVNQTNTLQQPFLPSALSGTQVGNSPAWKDRPRILGFDGFTEGKEALTWGAALDLDWNTYRTKRVTLGGDTTFSFLNSPVSSTNVERMVVQVIGDGTSVVSFTGATFQTAEVNTPPSGVRTFYVFESDDDGIAGYSDAFGSGFNPFLIGPLTPGYIPVASTTTNLTDSPLSVLATNKLAFSTVDPFLFHDQVNYNLSMGLNALNSSTNSGVENTAIGVAAFYAASGISYGTAIGFDAATSMASALGVTAIGNASLHDSIGDYGTALGYRAGHTNYTGTNTVFVGYDANPLADTDDNTVVIGGRAIGNGPNTVTLGDANITAAYIGNTQFWPGGGSSLWAVDGGYLFPSPQVDTLSITNSAADGSPVFSLDTSVLHTGGNIHEWKNLGTNYLEVIVTDPNEYNLQLKADGTADDSIELRVSKGSPQFDSIRITSAGSLVFLADQNLETTGTLTTGDPGVGGTGAIQFGGLMTSSAITMVVTNYIPVSINGNTNFVIPLATFTP